MPISPVSFDDLLQKISLDLACPNAVLWEKPQHRDGLSWTRGMAEPFAAGAVWSTTQILQAGS